MFEYLQILNVELEKLKLEKSRQGIFDCLESGNSEIKKSFHELKVDDIT